MRIPGRTNSAVLQWATVIPKRELPFSWLRGTNQASVTWLFPKSFKKWSALFSAVNYQEKNIQISSWTFSQPIQYCSSHSSNFFFKFNKVRPDLLSVVDNRKIKARTAKPCSKPHCKTDLPNVISVFSSILTEKAYGVVENLLKQRFNFENRRAF